MATTVPETLPVTGWDPWSMFWLGLSLAILGATALYWFKTRPSQYR